MHQLATIGLTRADAHDQRRRKRQIQRWGTLLGGGALTLFGLSRRSAAGVALAAVGGALAYIGAKTTSAPRDFLAESSMLLNCAPEEAYALWHDFEELPAFMNRVEAVTPIGNPQFRQYRWVAVGPFGRRITWDAEIISDRPNQAIAWTSLPNSKVSVQGVVEFRPAPANRGTIVTVRIMYNSVAGSVAQTVGKMLGRDPSFLLRQDLRRMKALAETGEIPTVEGQTHGPRSAKVAALRMIDPTRPIRSRGGLQEVFSAKRRIA
jgi:uncharacterized membrane protein